MRRFVICLVLMGLMLSVCGRKWTASHSETLSQRNSWLQNSYDECEDMSLQLDLVRWYNLNLCAERPDKGFREAYRSILCLEDGAMGYVEFPSLDRTIPIYHEGAAFGVVHSAQSDFPVGGTGNHTVLTCVEPLRLQSGDCFVICIFDQRLIYRVGEASDDLCTLICGNASYACGRVISP